MSEIDKKWYYSQVLSITQAVKEDAGTADAGAPPLELSPYRGIAAQSPTTPKKQEITLDLELQDISGNRANNAVDNPEIPVGYFDEIIGVSNWPGVGCTYEINKEDNEAPKISLHLSFDTTAYDPAKNTGATVETIIKTAAKHRDLYKTIYYQLKHEGPAFVTLETTLQSGAIELPISEIKGFIIAIYTYLNAISALVQATVTTAADTNLQAQADANNCSVADIVGENPSLRFAPGSLTLPEYHVFKEGETLGDLDLSADAFSANAHKPLTPGVIVNAAPGTEIVFTNNIQAIARTMYDEAVTKGFDLPSDANDAAKLAQVLEANKDHLLRAHMELTVNETTHTTGYRDTLASFRDTFNDANLTLSQVALAAGVVIFRDNTRLTLTGSVDSEESTVSYHYAASIHSIAAKAGCTVEKLLEDNLDKITVPGIDPLDEEKAYENRFLTDVFTDGCSLVIADHIIGEDETLGAYTWDQVNAAVNLFPAGTAVYTGTDTYELKSGDTLESIAPAKDLEPEDIAAHNSSHSLETGITLLLPAFTTTPPAFTAAPTTLEAEIGFTNTETIFPLIVEIVMTRNGDLIDDDFKDAANVSVSRSRIAPQQQEAGDAPNALTTFAEKFEKAFAGLKVGSGERSGLGSHAQSEKLWVVNFNETNGIKAVFDSVNGPNFFAIAPLSRKLLSKSEVDVFKYTGDTFDSTQTEPLDFKSVDLDKWMKSFLETIDLVLSPAYALPIHKLIETGNLDTLESAPLDTIINGKGKLAQMLSERVDSILVPKAGSDAAPVTAANLANAKESLRQRLLVELAKAYEIDSMVQVPFSVTNPRPTPPPNSDTTSLPPRLYGKLTTETQSQIAVDPANVPPLDPANAEPTKQKNYSFSVGKLPLGNGAADATFMFDVKPEWEHREEQFHLDLDYRISGMEYDIHRLARDGDDTNDAYEDSSWLTFIKPIESGQLPALSTSIGKTAIPVPSRSYPIPPTLQGQKGESSLLNGDETQAFHPSDTLEEKIEKAMSWDYEFIYDDLVAAQDRIYLKVDFNTVNEAASLDAAVETSDPLFDPLASFTTVSSQLNEDLSLLPSIKFAADDNADDDRQKKAVYALSMLQAITKKLVNPQIESKSLRSTRRGPTPEHKTYEYELEVETNTDADADGYIVKYQQQYDDDPLTCIYARKRGADADSPWKEAYKCIELEPTAEERVFKYPSGLSPFDQSLEYKFCFNNRDVIVNQNAWAGVYVTRNEELDYEDLKTDKKVNEAFVYRTPMVHFLNKMIPTIRVDEVIDINPGIDQQPGNTPLENALNNFFTALFSRDLPDTSTRDHKIKVSVRYGHNVSGEEDELITFVPIHLIPSYPFNLAGDCPGGNKATPLVEELRDKLKQWKDANNPSKQQGAYFFDVCIYSDMYEKMVQPMLELRNIRYKLPLEQPSTE